MTPLELEIQVKEDENASIKIREKGEKGMHIVN